MPDRRAPIDADHRRLALRLHERGLWMVEVRRTDDGYAILTTTTRVEVEARDASTSQDAWADAAADRVLEVLVADL